MRRSGSKIQTMYLVIRCSGCHHMMTAPDSSQNVLCPVCGVTNSIRDTRVYLTCQERSVAEDIARQLGDIIRQRKGKDLNEEEIIMLRQRFEAWERHTRWS
jgi:LSD1 subclass zinc finger protein